MTELVHYELERKIATITLDSPANRNALSTQLVTELRAHLEAAGADDGVRAVVLTHSGTVFCAGADLKEQSGEGGPQAGTQRMLGLMRAIVELPKPVVTRIDGAVRAGGLGIIGASDIAVAASRSTFAFTEVRLGLAPAIISLTTLGRMTERAASRYYLTGEKFDADAAARCGLLSSVVEDLDAEITAITDALRLCSPQGLAETKPVTTARIRESFEAGAQDMQSMSARLFSSEEAREGMMSFLQKRAPRWAEA
ncbi:MAG: enoyl-CoA hydratase family protein [Jatrophihabitans sp.]